MGVAGLDVEDLTFREVIEASIMQIPGLMGTTLLLMTAHPCSVALTVFSSSKNLVVVCVGLQFAKTVWVNTSEGD